MLRVEGQGMGPSQISGISNLKKGVHPAPGLAGVETPDVGIASAELDNPMKVVSDV